MKVKIQALGPCFAIIPSSDCCDKSIFTVENASPAFSLETKGDLCDTFIELYLATFMKGDSPYIGENGNWWVGTTDTGVKAEGGDGRGIVSILKTSTQELTDTYTITYTDDTTNTFDVTNGVDGVSVESITLYETVGLVDTYEIVYSSGSRTYFDVTNGADGVGTDGRGIVSIIKTSTVGLVDTYTITYTDATTSTFDVTNGAKGDDGTSAYQIYVAGGGTLSEVDYNASITNIPTHIADATKHIDTTTDEFTGTLDETNDKLTIWDNSLLKWIRFSFTSLKTFIGTHFLRLDQTTPQPLTSSPKINDLVAGQMCYVDANKQLKSVSHIKYNVAKNRLEVGDYIETYTETVPFTLTGNMTLTGQLQYQNGSTISGLGRLYFAANDILFRQFNSTVITRLIIKLTTGNVGVGVLNPKSALQVAGGIQCGDDTAAASADKVGTTRYRATANASYVEMCVQIGATSFQWQTILTNTW